MRVLLVTARQDGARLSIGSRRFKGPLESGLVNRPLLRETIERWFAVVFLLNGECARRALEEAARAPSANAA